MSIFESVSQALDALDVGEPHTYLGLVAVLGVQLIVVGSSFLHARITNRRSRSTRSDVAAIHHSVNGRPTTLRTDLDDMRADQKTILAELAKMSTGQAEMRGELKGLTHRVDEMSRPTLHRPRQSRTGW